MCVSNKGLMSCPVSGTSWVCSRNRITATMVFLQYLGLKTQYLPFTRSNYELSGAKVVCTIRAQLNCMALLHYSIWCQNNRKGYCGYLQVCQQLCRHVSCFVYIRCTPAYQKCQKLAATMLKLAYLTPFLLPTVLADCFVSA